MDEPTEAEASEEKRIATDGLPLAAIFKTRRAGRRKSTPAGDRSVAEANARRQPERSGPVPGAPPPEFDVALTDAFAVDRSVADFGRGTPVIEEADDGLVALDPLAGELIGQRGAEDPPRHRSIAASTEGLPAGRPEVQRPTKRGSPARPPPLPVADEVPDDTVDMEGEAVPVELLSTADDLRRLRQLLPPHADLAWAQEAVLVLGAHDLSRFRTPSRGAWFTELFGEEYLASQPSRSDMTVAREVSFLRDRLDIQPGQHVLDVACGTGRHARSFARQGCKVTAVDASLPMLRRGIEAARREGSEVRFLQIDMRDLVFEDAFDAAWMVDTSFGFFSDIENLMVLRSLWRALHPGGRLLVDVVNRDYLASDLPTRNWWEGEGCLVQEDIEFAHATSRLEIRRYLVFADGRERVYDISIRVFSAHELVRLMQHAGFEVLDVTGSLHTIGAFFGPGSERILLTARRPAK